VLSRVAWLEALAGQGLVTALRVVQSHNATVLLQAMIGREEA
jgi:hypothetical protein